MPLTENQAKNAKPLERAYKLADSEGLFLLVQPNGAKLWRMKYRFAGKEKLLSFGAYPALGIAAAREKRRAAKAVIAEGKDPMLTKGQVTSEGGDQGTNSTGSKNDDRVSRRRNQRRQFRN